MFQKYLDGQYRRPSGIVGRWIGARMVEQHRPENLWTVAWLNVQPADQVLEVGFGAGFAIAEVANRLTTGQIAGVDCSQTMVKAARRRNAHGVRSGKVDLQYGDAADLPFADQTFDKAYSIHSLYFWPDLLAGLHELARVLTPGGLIVLTFLPVERWNGSVPVPTPEFKPYTGDDVRASLQQSGFINVRIESDPNLQYRSNFSVIGHKA